MFASLSVDTGAVRGYGAACAAQATDLDAAAARLSALGTGPPEMFGPVAARFIASLARAAEAEARTITHLGASVAGATAAATESAGAYEATDDAAAARVTGIF